MTTHTVHVEKLGFHFCHISVFCLSLAQLQTMQTYFGHMGSCPTFIPSKNLIHRIYYLYLIKCMVASLKNTFINLEKSFKLQT